MKEYTPYVWSEDCELSEEERAVFELQRKDLWRHGIRKQPTLDVMAFEFAYVVCLLRDAAKETGGKVEFPPHWRQERIAGDGGGRDRPKGRAGEHGQDEAAHHVHRRSE